MIDPIETIRIYNPQGKAYYSDAEKTSMEFPVTNSCERSAKLMGDDYVRLVFKLPNKVVFDTYAFIEYDGQTFFLKETYRPTPNGCLKETVNGKEQVSSAYYSYDVKFVSLANMLTKPICYRHVVVKGAGGEQHVWDEPEISINGTLETLYQIIIGSIQQAANRLPASHYKDMLASIAANGKFTNGAKPDGVQLTPNTKLVSFSFSGDNIANVCTSVANSYTEDSKDTEWFITEDANHSCTLHFAKCESADTAQVLSDYEWENNGTDRFARPYLNGGLKSVEYAQAWSDVPQVIVPYGADRNMSGISVVGIDETTQMQSTFGKRLRLDPNTTYNVHDKNGENATTITTDAHGALSNPNVNTGIEITKFYDDIYPQCHFKITKVEVKNKRQSGETVPEYTCEGIAVDARYTKEYLAQKGMFPLRIEEATTLSVRFESGFLNGREFEIANKTHKDQGSTGYSLKFTIVADGSIEDGTLIPSGNFKPNVGDQFALFNMKMPAEFVSLAKQDLAQRAYEELLDLQNTRPEVKCTSEPFTFMQHTVSFGAIMQVSSELFGDEPFISRVIAYSYKLTSPSSVQFSLASAVMQGTLSEMNNAISDVTHTAGGLEQRAINLSRRGWRDANEVADMLDSITSEMMLVGNERYQFGFTSSIECVDSGNKFASLRIGYGSLQHTQEPYINYANKGLWEISGATLTKDVNGTNLDPDTPYYLFAQVADDTNPARLILTTDAHRSESEDDMPYLLLGILSSEFEGRRVFSRTNGYTAIEGGTITTEQIQDASRNLIIDFQSNPPRIIARNGAEIIGSVKFSASDTKTAEEQLRDLGFDVEDAKWLNLYADGDLSFNYMGTDFPKHKGLLTNLPKGTYQVSIVSENNGNDGSVAFDGFENSCLVWFKAGAGDGYDVNDVLQGYKDQILAISNWGDDVTINEPADVVLYTCTKDVIRSTVDSNSYPEFPASGTWTINGIQIMELVSTAISRTENTAKDALSAANEAQDSIDNMEIGGENLYTGDNPLTIKEANYNYNNAALVKLQNGEQYIFSCGKSVVKTGSTTKFSLLLYDNTVTPNAGYGYWKLPVRTTRVEQVFTVPVKGDWELRIYAGEFHYTSGISMEFTDIMVQKGNRATAYQAAVGFLGKAIKDGSTDIAGGLVMTNVLMLKNEKNKVTAGMSGLTGTDTDPEKVLLWGGGTYQEALKAIQGLAYLPVLLTKAGAGSNIGCLKVMSDNKTIMVTGKDGTMNVVITSETSDYISKNIYNGYFYSYQSYLFIDIPIHNPQTKELLSLPLLPDQNLTLNIDNILLKTRNTATLNFYSSFEFSVQLIDGSTTTNVPLVAKCAILYVNYFNGSTLTERWVAKLRADVEFDTIAVSVASTKTKAYIGVNHSQCTPLDGKTLTSGEVYYVKYDAGMGTITRAYDATDLEKENGVTGLSVADYPITNTNAGYIKLIASDIIATVEGSCSFGKLSLFDTNGLCIIASDGITIQKGTSRFMVNISDQLDIVLDGLPTANNKEKENHLYYKQDNTGARTLMLSNKEQNS